MTNLLEIAEVADSLLENQNENYTEAIFGLFDALIQHPLNAVRVMARF